MAPKKRNGGVAAIMSHAEILEHFGTARVQTLPTFRALCNALKALVIAAAVRALREVRRNRIIVCDVGCGKGGERGQVDASPTKEAYWSRWEQGLHKRSAD